MKPSTEALINLLNDAQIAHHMNNFISKSPDFVFNETHIVDAYTRFQIDRDLIMRAQEKDVFEQVPYAKRQVLLSTLKNLHTHLIQISAPPLLYDAANTHAVAYAQAIVNGLNVFADTVDNARLKERLAGFADYSAEIDSLQKVKKEYSDFLQQVSEVTATSEGIKLISEELKNTVNNLRDKIKELEEDKARLITLKDQAVNTSTTISQINQEIADKNVKITAFYNNIQQYETTISSYTIKAQEIIDKEKIINDLIAQAEKALSLKSAEGISAAFSAHYETTSDKWVLQGWVIGAVLFIASAIALTAWIVNNNDSDNLNALIGRIVAVGISITGATFCAKQFVKQKNIQEDYAYKSVLAKSVVAFTEEIKKRDDKKVAAYLEKVLSEIHKDPLRGRQNVMDKEFGLNAPELVEKLVNAVNRK